MTTYSRSVLEPNRWVQYVDADTGEVLHADAYRAAGGELSPQWIPPECLDAEPI